MGRASRLKRERKDQPPDRRLLMTLTNEPFQPVRLYYSIPDRDSVLDQNVTVIDPREAEAAFGREFKDVRTKEDAERVAAEGLERGLKSKEDVPLIEDFPLAPEEETPDFRHLMITLQLRLIRAMEHWRGNTDLTLTALIMRAVKQGGVLAGEPFTVTCAGVRGVGLPSRAPPPHRPLRERIGFEPTCHRQAGSTKSLGAILDGAAPGPKGLRPGPAAAIPPSPKPLTPCHPHRWCHRQSLCARKRVG